MFLTKSQSIVQGFIGFQPKLQHQLAQTRNRDVTNITRKGVGVGGPENGAVRLN
jgi:hypothetical protein